jgi:hypothetical protein
MLPICCFSIFLSSAACIRGMPAAIAFICRQQQQSYEVCYYCFFNIPRIVVCLTSLVIGL